MLSRLCLFVSLSLVGSPAFAATILFTDRALFESFVQPDVTVTFDTFSATNSDFCRVLTWPYSCSGVADNILYVSQEVGLQPLDPPTGVVQFQPNVNSIRFHLDSGIEAIGFDLLADAPTQYLAITAADGTQIRLPVALTFIGLRFDEPVSFVELYSGLAAPTLNPAPIVVDNMAIRRPTATSVPEPPTSLLGLAGVVGIVALRKRISPSYGL
jgi:hypothetical protein